MDWFSRLLMKQELSNSSIDRKNILNNPYALDHIKHEVGLKGFSFGGEYYFTTRQVASFFEVELRTVERYLSDYGDEIRSNGYEVIGGKKLQEFKEHFGTDINVGTKTTVLGLFSFKAFLNLGMLLVESEKARILRGLILDIVIDVISAKAGGTTKYVNQRDEAYLISLYAGENYRKDFIKALKDCVEMGNFKYPIYTNKVYKSIFKEHAGEYREILSLTNKENVRDTMYSEVLTTISMYETGLANRIEERAKALNRKLLPDEVDLLFDEFEKDPTWKPQIDMARMRMASRDYGLRSVTHPELVDYINPLDATEFERFLGRKSAELAERIEEYQEVFKRLKDR
jgi:hypothetical protein